MSVLYSVINSRFFTPNITTTCVQTSTIMSSCWRSFSFSCNHASYARPFTVLSLMASCVDGPCSLNSNVCDARYIQLFDSLYNPICTSFCYTVMPSHRIEGVLCLQSPSTLSVIHIAKLRIEGVLFLQSPSTLSVIHIAKLRIEGVLFLQSP
eukprot:1059466_1